MARSLDGRAVLATNQSLRALEPKSRSFRVARFPAGARCDTSPTNDFGAPGTKPLWRRLLQQNREKIRRVTGSRLNKPRIDQLEQVEPVPRLVVSAFLRVLRSVTQTFKNRLLIDHFDILSTGQRISKKSLLIVRRQRIRVGQKPSLHYLDHQMNLIIIGTVGSRPIVALTLT